MPSRTPKVSWAPAFRRLRALAVRQPYAWLIGNGYKDVENRSRNTRHRGPLLIHASTSKANLTEERLHGFERRYGFKLPPKETYELGGIVGLVDLVDCRSSSTSRFYERGNKAWVLAKPRRLDFRPCKGALNLFTPVFD